MSTRNIKFFLPILHSVNKLNSFCWGFAAVPTADGFGVDGVCNDSCGIWGATGGACGTICCGTDGKSK